MARRNGGASGARAGLWAAAILAVGALACGLGGGALAAVLPAAGQAAPLPVYTSLSLATEDEPLPPVWRDYDPDDLIDLTALPPEDQDPWVAAGLPGDWYGLCQTLLFQTGLLWWDDAGDPAVPWQTMASAPGQAAYLVQFPVPDGATVVDASHNEVTPCGAARLDVGLREGCVSVRFSFPDLPAATAEDFAVTQALAQQCLLDLFRGYTDHFMGAQTMGWLAERTAVQPGEEWQAAVDAMEGTLEDKALAVCEAVAVDLQTIRLENELLVVLSDRNDGGMCSFYCDVRLHSVTGYIWQT